MDKISMTFSWYNIRDEYQNTQIKYSNVSGTSWFNINFVPEMYSYSDLSNYISEHLEYKGHKPNEDTNPIKISFVLSTYRVLIQLSNNFWLDLRSTRVGELLGFEQKLVKQTEYSSKLPNITSSIVEIQMQFQTVL